MPRAEDLNVIQTVAPKRSDQVAEAPLQGDRRGGCRGGFRPSLSIIRDAAVPTEMSSA
jgi:hypothetical protein